MRDLKGKLRGLLNMVVDESKKKELGMNCKKSEFIMVIDKRDSPRCELHIADMQIELMWKFKYPVSETA